MDISWDDVQLFLAVAETGSLSAAARRLKLGQPTVSRRLAQLEDRLGYELFRRQAQGVVLTDEGERILAPARRMAEWAGEITRAASRHETAPSGLVRVAAPPGVAFDFVAPFAAMLRERHPRIRLEVLSTVQYLDLHRGEADLALRMRAPPEGDLTTIASVRHRNAVMVSRSYAAELPPRPSLADLRWICWAPPYEDLPPRPQLEQLVPDFAPAFTSDNFLVQLRAAEAGVGAMVLTRARHRLSTLSLVPLDIDLGPHAESAMHLVAPKSALDIPRVRAVAGLLADELRRMQDVTPA